MQSRYYNPEWGRFINADAILGHAGELLSHNLFSYCSNNTINYQDPSGFERSLYNEGATGGGGGRLVSLNTTKWTYKGASYYKELSNEAVVNRAESKASILSNNRAQGKAFEQQEFSKFSKRTENAVEQVTIKTNQGTKIRVDAIGLDTKTGEVVIYEFKSSITASLTPNQKIGFPELQQGGGTVAGKGKGIFIGGYNILAGTNVEIVRPK